MKQIDLCARCAALLSDGGYSIKMVKRGINNKVTCGHCNRRRYGATYELTPIRGKDSEEKRNESN